jgi:hypothetical protein
MTKLNASIQRESLLKIEMKSYIAKMSEVEVINKQLLKEIKNHIKEKEITQREAGTPTEYEAKAIDSNLEGKTIESTIVIVFI